MEEIEIKQEPSESSANTEVFIITEYDHVANDPLQQIQTVVKNLEHPSLIKEESDPKAIQFQQNVTRIFNPQVAGSSASVRKNVKIRTCNICQREFSRKDRYEKHVATCSLSSEEKIKKVFKIHKCLECGKEFKLIKLFHEHCQLHIDEKKLRCIKCGLICKDIDDFNKHLEEHNKFECYYCGQKFLEKNRLYQHIMYHHAEEKFQCALCQMSFKTKTIFNNHQRDVHDPEAKKNPPFCCDHCGKRFTEKRLLRIHLGHAFNLRRYKCSFCDKSFNAASGRRQHMKIHKRKEGGVKGQEKKFLCHLCSRSFTLKTSLNSHIRYHSIEKKFKCKICDRAVAKESTLARHLNVHYRKGQISDERNFCCAVCGKTYKTKAILKQHSICHSEKKFKCNICEKSFNQQNNLDTHLNYHHDKKQFQCSLCDAKFNSRSNVNYHEKKFHPDGSKELSGKPQAKKGKRTIRRISPEEAAELEKIKETLVSQKKKKEKQGDLKVEIKSSADTQQPTIETVIELPNTESFPDPDVHDFPEDFDSSYNIEHSDNEVEEIPEIQETQSQKSSLIEEIYVKTEKEDVGYIEKPISEELLLEGSIKEEPEVIQESEVIQGPVVMEDPAKNCKKKKIRRKVEFGEIDFSQYAEKIEFRRSNKTFFIYKCLDCGIEIKTNKKFNRHYQVHYDEKNLKCSKCGLSLQNPDDYKKHVESHKFECDFCGEVCPDKNRIYLHIMYHHSERKYKCPLCPSSFKTQQILKNHHLSHHYTESENTTKFCCHHCGKTFLKKLLLTRHLQHVYNKRSFKCTVCDKGFNTSSGRRQHMKQHNPEKNMKFICEVCNKGFVWKTALNSHLKTHGIGKMLKCTSCNQEFKWKATYNSHVCAN
jgi:KRAB domain-containing zinc finger protein